MTRAQCSRCLRPAGHCLCAHIPALNSRTRVLILQHPQESLHPWNTARLAALGLRNARLIVGEHFDAELWQDPAVASWLLFPGVDAIPPATLVTSGESRPIQLIVPDATWRKARGLLSANPTLARLPRLVLPAPPPSAYGIRKAREAGAVATVEAIALTLNELEAPADFSALLAPLHVLVQRQQSIQAQALSGRPRRSASP